MASSTIDLIGPVSLLRFALEALFLAGLSAGPVWVVADSELAVEVGTSTVASDVVADVAIVAVGAIVSNEDVHYRVSCLAWLCLCY